MDRGLVKSIAELLGSADEVLEAHLPQCYVPDTMQQPAQILVVVLRDTADSDSVLTRIREGLANLIVPGHYLDVWPLPANSSMLAAVRAAGCDIESLLMDRETETLRLAKKWWKLW